MFKEVLLTKKSDGRGKKRKGVFGLGTNDAPYGTTYRVGAKTYMCPYFVRWTAMFTRCYSLRWLKANPSYLGCTVAPEWHSFMAFKAWMMAQDWQEKQLDKDLLSLEKKRYSPETCLFVTRAVNSFFNEKDRAQGALPLGIYERKGKYEVGASKGEGKRTWVGVFDTVPDAIDAYTSDKAKSAKHLADKQTDRRIAEAIMGYSAYFTEKLQLLKAAY